MHTTLNPTAQQNEPTERLHRCCGSVCNQIKETGYLGYLPSSTGFAPFFLNFGRMPRSMLWTSPLTTEFPAVRTFALQKKLAIMAAHDSILSARVKQTQDTNRKRWEPPFQTGDLVYLSSKNISFARGLARKLIPKFIGPYKILHDFGNSSFRLDLPPHLKQRGVHDVFHTSLLREHIPNDNRLFPGRMGTQVGNTPETEGEWAVNRILSHAGSKEDSIFEIKWKSGDVTWLPHYQITHLQALTDYLDLLGINEITDLPSGSGQAPREDPQVFLETIFYHPQPTTVSECSDAFSVKRPLENTQLSGPPLSEPLSTATKCYPDTTTLAKLNMPSSRRSLRGIRHPLFVRTSPTVYLM